MRRAARRLEADHLELVGDVIDRLGLGARSRAAALEGVRRDRPVDVRQALRAERAHLSGKGRNGGNHDRRRGEPAELVHCAFLPKSLTAT